MQIEKNLDNLQVLLMDHDTRTFELCKKVFEVVAICGQESQRDAAFFLTEQLPLVQEERREIVMENEQFHLSNQEIINDIEKIKGTIERVKVYIDPSIDLDNASQNEVLNNFKEKLDRVSERVEQEKNLEKVSILSDLRSQLEEIELATAKEGQRRTQLQQKLADVMREKPLSDKQSLVQFFSSLVEAKDEHISKLTKSLESIQQRKREQNLELLQLREMVQRMSGQYESLKTKQKNFSAAVIEGERTGDHSIYTR